MMETSMVCELCPGSDAGGVAATWFSKAWLGLVGGQRRAQGGAPGDAPPDEEGRPAPSANAPLTNAEVAEVYEKYGLLIWRRSRASLRSDEWADDALQDVFVKVMRHGASLRLADSKLAWLYTVTDRCCIDIARRRRRGFVPIDGAFADAPFVDARACPIEGRNFISRLLARLGPMERSLAVLMFGEGCTQTEAARRLGWSRQTINKKAKLIRQRADEME
jgi:RNA polymerase sigma factor (sigma-70 family)